MKTARPLAQQRSMYPGLVSENIFRNTPPRAAREKMWNEDPDRICPAGNADDAAVRIIMETTNYDGEIREVEVVAAGSKVAEKHASHRKNKELRYCC
jgi:hypothetical protein